MIGVVCVIPFLSLGDNFRMKYGVFYPKLLICLNFLLTLDIECGSDYMRVLLLVLPL